MRSRFLEVRDPLVRETIFAKAASVSEALGDWATSYAPIRTVRTYPLALSVTAAAPFSDVQELFATARVSLWVFTLDDLFDEEALPPAELLQRTADYRAIARGEPIPDSTDPLALALADVRRGLAAYPLFAALGSEWASALCRTIDAMVLEQRWRLAYRRDGLAGLPRYDEYLANGLNSIGGPPHIWSAIITTDDASVLRCRKLFREFERIASTCVRLANDLQSHAKEVAEEKLNSLVIVSQAFIELGFDATRAHRLARVCVKAAIARELAALDWLQGRTRTRTGRPEAVATDIARFVCEFYTHYDYHTYATTGQPGGLSGS